VNRRNIIGTHADTHASAVEIFDDGGPICEEIFSQRWDFAGPRLPYLVVDERERPLEVGSGFLRAGTGPDWGAGAGSAAGTGVGERAKRLKLGGTDGARRRRRSGLLRGS